MIKTEIENFLWVNKYRPRMISECVLPDEIKNTFEEIVKSGNMQNLLLTGTAGCGKTTIARLLCDAMDLEYLFLNASEFGNIDTLRTTVRNFASTVSLNGNKKVVILDEADHLNPQSTQPALRGFIEEFAGNCRFIFTCNFKNRIIEPLHSRCTTVDFKIATKDKANLADQFMRRMVMVLTTENVKFENKVLAELIIKYFPDFRRIIGELQRYAVGGTIDTGILTSISEVQISELVTHMKAKNYTEVRRWVAQNIDIDAASLFRKLYDSLAIYFDKKSIPAIVLILGEYQYKMAFSADHEICLAACMAEIMLNAEFK